MASAQATLDLEASPESVWELIGGFGTLTDWLPGIPRNEITDGGRIRRLGTPDGQVIVERLEKYDFAEKTYSYSILESPFPISDYYATLTVKAGTGGGTRVEWGATFTPKDVPEEKAQRLFQKIFSGGLEALASHFKRSS
jgi:uncharacterized protein YndB with AHSA1/START domain